MCYEKLQFYLKPICFNTKKDNKKMKPKEALNKSQNQR
ncbi:hypothetical protein F6453_2023 [Marinobacter nauticus]|uniref:Uncharacterized protein n=1 Tax=Marinobacter nauticus TaxID=2743 RepID=A0A833NDN4_MARNT|nr:hypothetical protein F6453_2023 [Marinobacter nauticus]